MKKYKNTTKMKKIIKWCFGFVFSFFVLLFIALTIIISFINPNDYKNKIESSFAQKTGLKLNIKGKINWQVFPAFKISASQAAIKDKKDKTIAYINKTSLKINIFPLLLKKIQIKTVIIDGANLKRYKNKRRRL